MSRAPHSCLILLAFALLTSLSAAAFLRSDEGRRRDAVSSALNVTELQSRSNTLETADTFELDCPYNSPVNVEIVNECEMFLQIETFTKNFVGEYERYKCIQEVPPKTVALLHIFPNVTFFSIEYCIDRPEGPRPRIGCLSDPPFQAIEVYSNSVTHPSNYGFPDQVTTKSSSVPFCAQDNDCPASLPFCVNGYCSNSQPPAY